MTKWGRGDATESHILAHVSPNPNRSLGLHFAPRHCESLQRHYIYTYDGACKVLGLEATILAEKGFTRFPSTRPAAEPRPGTPPLAPDGTPGNPQRPQQQWAGVWGRYSGAGAPGGPQTRTRRISRVRCEAGPPRFRSACYAAPRRYLAALLGSRLRRWHRWSSSLAIGVREACGVDAGSTEWRLVRHEGASQTKTNTAAC